MTEKKKVVDILADITEKVGVYAEAYKAHKLLVANKANWDNSEVSPDNEVFASDADIADFDTRLKSDKYQKSKSIDELRLATLALTEAEEAVYDAMPHHRFWYHIKPDGKDAFVMATKEARVVSITLLTIPVLLENLRKGR